MALNLQKGQQSVLSDGGKVPKRLLIALGWEPPSSSNRPYDLDATLICRGVDGKTIEPYVCFFNQMICKNPAGVTFAEHTADVLDGVGAIAGSDDDEQIILPDLSAIPPEVVSMDIVVTIYDAVARGQYFGELTFAFVRVEDPDGIIQARRIELTADQLFSDTGMCFATLTRKGPTWTLDPKFEGGARWADLEKALG